MYFLLFICYNLCAIIDYGFYVLSYGLLIILRLQVTFEIVTVLLRNLTVLRFCLLYYERTGLNICSDGNISIVFIICVDKQTF